MSLLIFQNYSFIGIGSNLSSAYGLPRDNVLKAIKQLEPLSDEPLIASSLLLSKPLNCSPGSPDFINTVVALRPRKNETAINLLHVLQHIENSMGRVRSELKNEARIIDLDLLTFKEGVSSSKELVLPHPEILNRNFVLEPLQELLEQTEFKHFINFIKKNSASQRS